MTRILPLIAALLVSTSAFAHDAKVGDLKIGHPFIPAPIASAKSAAGFMSITNSGTTIDHLIGIEADFAGAAMLHTTEHSADGVARMKHVPALEIPAGQTVTLEPGALHVMFMGLKAAPATGEKLPATLVFETAGRVVVEFTVDDQKVEAAQAHSTMTHNTEAADHATHGPMSTTGLSDDAAITALLKAQFDRPEAPLSVAPIVVQGDVAVAGWSQDGKGGRAFLRRDADGWAVEICAGESLTEAATLQNMGLGATEAAALQSSVAAAEQSLSADIIAQFNAFEGVVMVGKGDHDH